MGFYPVTPGSTSYAIGSPLFGKVTIRLGSDRKFTILAENNSDTNKYIQSATLNGRPLDKPWISHEDIMNGWTLIFKMGPEPNKSWGTGAPPPSISD
jgi:putative alpha-1,2-mannosidase